MKRLPIKFNVEPHGKINVSGIRVVYEVRDDGYYYFVDFEKLVEIVESQQRIINGLLEKKNGVAGNDTRKGIPTARNSEDFK